jgi:hypothetical protein
MNLKPLLNPIIILVLLDIIPITVMGSQTSLGEPAPSSSFLEMEYFYDSHDKKIILYFWSGNSMVIYTDLVVKFDKGDQENAYEVYIAEVNITSKFASKTKPRIKLIHCEDAGFMVSFDAPVFKPDHDLVIYETPGDARRLINYLGGSKEAEARKMKP